MTTNTADVPPPAGAVEVHEWYNLAGALSRYFTGSAWVIERDDRPWVAERDARDISVRIDGTQYPEGRVTRFIGIFEGNRELLTELLTELTGTDAIEVGRALIAAGEEVVKIGRPSTPTAHASTGQRHRL